MIATIAFAWWFRRGNTKATYRPDWEYSGAIELVVWSIPALTIMLLAASPGSEATISNRASRSIRRCASQCRSRVARLEMAVHLPRSGRCDRQSAGRSGRHAGQLPADLGDGLERFCVPQIGTMVYAMPRMTTRLNLQADRDGVYNGLSSHFSGDGFPGMAFKAQSMPPDQFAIWAQARPDRGLSSTGRVCGAGEANQLCEADDLRGGRADLSTPSSSTSAPNPGRRRSPTSRCRRTES